MKRFWWIGILVIVLAGAATGFEIGRSSVTTTTSAVTTSSVSEQTWIAAWPRANGVAYATPTAVARAFATQFLAMGAPIVGPFQRGDSRSGEVRVTSYAGGPVTTVLVRQLTPSNVWWVLGSSTPDITISQPRALATVASQFVIAGESTAYEAVVNVTLWSDSLATPVLHTTVMGGSMGVRAHFQKTLSVIGHPGPATIVMYVISAKDGSVMAASTARFRLGA
ncbi:MAG TPA: Gmad2 immunoglobulin-like domain-containing protein [Acidimicrobiales bacterium]|nr:Gmad2 immunoglobulin-like domain-containing protein [Acidimicrobiales bacterium]